MRFNLKDLVAHAVQKNNCCLLRETCEIYKNMCGQDADLYDVKVGGK
jgi:hypothetical protein